MGTTFLWFWCWHGYTHRQSINTSFETAWQWRKSLLLLDIINNGSKLLIFEIGRQCVVPCFALKDHRHLTIYSNLPLLSSLFYSASFATRVSRFTRDKLQTAEWRSKPTERSSSIETISLMVRSTRVPSSAWRQQIGISSSTITRPSSSSMERKFSNRCQSETTRGAWVAQTMRCPPRGGLHPKGRESLYRLCTVCFIWDSWPTVPSCSRSRRCHFCTHAVFVGLVV